MLTESQKNELLNNFTFQSGYIPIKSTAYKTAYIFTLHSNLVIFQYTQTKTHNYAKPNFTFQSGYIPMTVCR